MRSGINAAVDVLGIDTHLVRQEALLVVGACEGFGNGSVGLQVDGCLGVRITMLSPESSAPGHAVVQGLQLQQ